MALPPRWSVCRLASPIKWLGSTLVMHGNDIVAVQIERLQVGQQACPVEVLNASS